MSTQSTKRINRELTTEAHRRNDTLKAAIGRAKHAEDVLAQSKDSLRRKQEHLQAWEEELRERENRSMGETFRLRLDTMREQRDKWKTQATSLKHENRRLQALVVDMLHELNYTSVRADDGYNKCLERMAQFDERLAELGLWEDE